MYLPRVLHKCFAVSSEKHPWSITANDYWHVYNDFER